MSDGASEYTALSECSDRRTTPMSRAEQQRQIDALHESVASDVLDMHSSEDTNADSDRSFGGDLKHTRLASSRGIGLAAAGLRWACPGGGVGCAADRTSVLTASLFHIDF